MTGTYNMIISGIGGQGVVLVSNIIGEACAIAGKNVVSGEMFGLAQRSGSVFIHQRVGEGAVSPLVPYGDADVVLAFEVSEALRYLFYLKPGGTVVTNTRHIHPPGESHNLVAKKIKNYVSYDEIISNIKSTGARLKEVDALKLARQAGNPLTENVVMLGALSGLPEFPIEMGMIIEAVKVIVPPKAIEQNVNAFELGYSEIRGLSKNEP